MQKFIYTNKAISDIPLYSVGVASCDKGNFFEVQFVYKNTSMLVAKSDVVVFNPLETGDGYDYKVCNVCHRYLPTKTFSRNQNGKDNRVIRRPSCEDCRKIIDGVGIKDADRKEWEKNKPNMVIWECPICHKRTIPGLTSKVVLDHDHKTGIVRGWICDSCNTGIGRFKDEVALLRSAIKYLQSN